MKKQPLNLRPSQDDRLQHARAHRLDMRAATLRQKRNRNIEPTIHRDLPSLSDAITPHTTSADNRITTAATNIAPSLAISCSLIAAACPLAASARPCADTQPLQARDQGLPFRTSAFAPVCRASFAPIHGDAPSVRHGELGILHPSPCVSCNLRQRLQKPIM